MPEDFLKRIAVIGAAGKMGRGIALLLLQWVALSEKGTLILIDSREEALADLKSYLREQLRLYAEKKIVLLRRRYQAIPHLISNEEIIQTFVDHSLDQTLFATDPLAAQNASVVFEAILEDSALKAHLFKTIDAISSSKPYYFSNTSSIPISEMAEKSGIRERIMGVHFYNPPPVQDLVELIHAETTSAEVIQAAESLVKKLDKSAVYSQDVAGFIGNGHFVREIAFACEKVRTLEETLSRAKAISLVNHITEEALIRPMGIFQLVDYVGVDVCLRVAEIMSSRLNIALDLSLLRSFSYKMEPLADAELQLPPSHVPWKRLHKDSQKQKILELYLRELCTTQGTAAALAREFLQHSLSIAKQLVKEGVARSLEDVDTVLKKGFYHLYGSKEIISALGESR